MYVQYVVSTSASKTADHMEDGSECAPEEDGSKCAPGEEASIESLATLIWAMRLSLQPRWIILPLPHMLPPDLQLEARVPLRREER